MANDPNEQVAIRLPSQGKDVPAGIVTRRQYELLYKQKGWKIVDDNPPASQPSETERAATAAAETSRGGRQEG